MPPVRMSKIEEALRVVLAYNAACNRHDIMGMMQLISDNCVFESADPAPDGAVYSGKAEISKYWQDLFTEAPEVQIKLEDAFGFGDRCIKHWRYQVNLADAPSDFMRGVDIVKVNNGLICEIFSYVKGAFGGLSHP